MNNRIPPPVYLLICCLLMWLVSRAPFDVAFRIPYANALSWMLILTGTGTAVIAVWQFRQARTTIDPLRPGKASSLVATGLFSVSRNPMYLGMVIALLGVLVRLGSLTAAVVPAFFVWVITEVQIKPEEAALSQLFGDAYTDYCQRVRRWL